MNQDQLQTLQSVSKLLESKPHLWTSPELAFFRKCVLKLEELKDSEESEEEAPPDFEDDTSKMNTLNQKVKHAMQKKEYDTVISLANAILQINPDSVKAYRCRSEANWYKNNVKDAYFDMCEAQKIDYSEEYDVLHDQMKTAFSATQANREPKIPNFNLQEMMNNPAILQMAQNMMNDPNMMNMVAQMSSQMAGRNCET